MSFPRYPKTKPSSVEWLGDVPEHWETGSLRWLSRRYSGGTPDKTNLSYWEEGTVPWLNSGAVNDRLIFEPSAYITEEAFANSSAKWIPKGALVMALAGQGKTKGMVAQLAIPSTCNQSMAAIIPAPAINARFLFWWLESNYQNIRNMAGGDLRDGLNLELLGNISCPLSPLSEQTAIASFLDHETGKIDVLVEEQRRLIALLKEKRQAVISHAVTKGLNPHAPMKPSGVEWLGDVPEHWEVRKLSQLFRAGKGKNGQMLTKEFCALNEGDYPVYSGQTENEGVMGTWNQFEFEFGESGVLFSTTVGAKAMHLRQLFGRFSLSQNCMIIWPTSERCVTRFFYYHFQPLFQFQRKMIPEHMQASFRVEDLYGYAIGLPPADEQTAIIAFLDTEIAKLDTLTTEADRAIELLQERRTALISAAVTGKIDVRSFTQN